MKTKVLLMTLLIAVFTFAACNSTKSDKPKADDKNLIEGVLVDMNNLDGCGWIIKLQDGTKLQPINMDKFELEPKDGAAVLFSYKKVDMAGVCMVGQMVELLSIKEK
jgi:hypothetical protein